MLAIFLSSIWVATNICFLVQTLNNVYQSSNVTFIDINGTLHNIKAYTNSFVESLKLSICIEKFFKALSIIVDPSHFLLLTATRARNLK